MSKMNISKIIVPVDFSDDSENGLELALRVEQVYDADIQLVYVQPSKRPFYLASEDLEKREAEKKFKELTSKYSTRQGKLDFIIKKGKIYQEVVEQVEAFNDSIIVMTTHGASGFEEFFVGSNAYRIITATNRPVLTLKTGNIPKVVDRILVPIDHTEETRQKVPFALDLAKRYKAELHVIGTPESSDSYIKGKTEAYYKQSIEYLIENGIQAKNEMLEPGDKVKMILDYTENNKIDLVTIMTEQTPLIPYIYMGSEAHKILSSCKVPLLSITPKDFYKVRDSFMTFGATGVS